MPLHLMLTIAAIVILVLAGVMVIIAKFYRKVDQGRALIINKMKAEPEVTFTGGVVYPIIHRAEVMDISVKTIELDRRGTDGLICKDNIRADIKVNFFIRVNKTVDDVLRVAQAIGCTRASDRATLDDLFVAKFSEALKTVGKAFDFEELYTKRDEFKDKIIEVIGKDLNGYVLDDAAIDYLEQTPVGLLDEKNILDAQGIRKITELTTKQAILTNDFRQKERMELGSQNLAADEAVYRFDQQRAEAVAKKEKEIAVAKAQQENEAHRVSIEEQKLTALAQQKAEEEVKVGEQTKLRGIEVSEKAREREVGVEAVRVQKARELEDLSRERDVELLRIDKEKALEVERKAIADVIRGRISVEKGVAEEEERIKDLRAYAAADREKKVKIVGAEASAQERLVKDIKAAEAQEQVAKFNAREQLTLAEAKLEVADKEARSKIRMAEGVQAEEAATGLAKVRVEEANAVAVEKIGLAEARVTLEKMKAEAAGAEKKGLANVTVREAQAEATRKEGDATADVIKGTKLAEAAGDEEKGLVEARVREAEAVAIEKQGAAEASATEKKLAAEASGLAAKAEAMKALDGVGREHEEFRIQLEMREAVEMRSIEARVDIAQAQATVMSKAFEQAKINIVGGDGQFFDRFIKAVSLGQSIDGFIDHSESAQKVLGGYLDGDKSLTDDVKEVLSGGALSPEGLKDLSLAHLINKLAGDATGDQASKLKQLASQAKALGFGEK